jgi:predicted molibdopterin-dependent oxidoreductase YjgC
MEALERHWGVSLSHLPPGSPDVAGLLRDRRIKTAVILGEDPFGSPGYPPDLIEGLRAAELLVVGDLFPTATTAAADIVLPLSSTAESSGTMTNQEGRVLAFDRAVAPVAGVETWEILCGLAAHLGHGPAMAYGGTGEVTAEIARVVPWHTGADPAGGPAPGHAGRAAPTRVEFDPALAAGEVVPVETLALDASEARLARWFGESFRQARAALRRA